MFSIAKMNTYRKMNGWQLTVRSITAVDLYVVTPGR